MNVIIANKNKTMLDGLGIEVIKELEGEFNVDEIILKFQNFFYQRMLLDITSIKNYQDIKNLQKLSISLDMDKMILFLGESEETNKPVFLSNLVSMGIYNFAKNKEGIQYLYNNPNTYRDVAQFHQLNINTPSNESTQNNPIKNFVTNNNTEVEEERFNGTKIIGIKNLTKQSGATTLCYLMKKELSKHYNCCAIEIDKNDFNYFNDKDCFSTITSEFGTMINKNMDKDVIIVDINNSLVAESFCQDVLCLIEPSIIKLQKIVITNPTAFQNLKNKKIILNQSLLSNSDISTFEYEAGIKVFYNLIPINDRDKNIKEVNELLVKLGFSKCRNM